MQNILKYSAIALATANAQSADPAPVDTSSLPEQSPITVPKNLAKLACYLIEDGLVFNLSDLKSETYYNSGDLNFNYCAFAEWPASNASTYQTFAYKVDQAGNAVAAFTNNEIVPTVTLHKKEDSMNGQPWVTLSMESSTKCPTDDTLTVTFETDVMCDETIKGKGNAAILQADSDIVDCKVRVVIAHDAGCALMASQGFATFINEYPWVLGIVFILGGPLVALWGKVFARLVSTTLMFVFGTLFMIILFTSFGWMEETCGIVLSTIFALVVGLGTGFLCWHYKKFSFAVLGLVGGYFVGSVVYSICLAIGWNSIWGMLVLSILFAAGGCAATFKWPNFVVHVCTSGIGSYVFMRGWTYIFGGYPSESTIIEDIQNGVDPNLNYAFWIYISFFLLCWAGSYFFQHKKHNDHVDDTDDNWQRAKSDNN